jgi:hypothetical protein
MRSCRTQEPGPGTGPSLLSGPADGRKVQMTHFKAALSLPCLQCGFRFRFEKREMSHREAPGVRFPGPGSIARSKSPWCSNGVGFSVWSVVLSGVFSCLECSPVLSILLS